MPRCTIFRSNSWFLQNVNYYPPSSRSICGVLRLLFQTIQTFSHGKEVHFKVVIWNDAATLLDIVLSQVQLLSAASSTPLLTTLSCTSHFTKGRSCIFTERPKLLYSSYSLHPLASSNSILHNRPFLHFCRTVTLYLFLQKRHSTRTFLQNS